MSVYCVLVIRAWTYEYGHERDYYIHVGGFYTGNRPPVSPCMCFYVCECRSVSLCSDRKDIAKI